MTEHLAEERVHVRLLHVREATEDLLVVDHASAGPDERTWITLGNNDLADNDSGRRTDRRPLLALVGRVPVKVTAEGGPIAVGDLLTSSGTPGLAMRCGDRARCAGAIVGKALEPLRAGTGRILALVTLQ